MRGYSEREQRAAEDAIFRDMDRLDLVETEPEEKGGWWRLWALVGLVIAGAWVQANMGGCGTVAGFGDDLRQWSSGIRGSVAAQPQEGQ